MKFFLTSRLSVILYETAKKARRVIFLSGQSAGIKSGLLLRAADECEKKGLLCEKYLSEYDCDKLSAIYIAAEKTLAADASLFSAYPEIASKIINTDSLCRGGKDDIPEHIMRATVKTAAFRARAQALCGAVKPLLRERAEILEPYISDAKILNYIFRFIQRNRLCQNGDEGRETRALISCVTPWGVHTCAQTVMLRCRTVITVGDELGCVSQKLIGGLSKAFNQCGRDTLKLVCPFDDGISEHLIVPSLSLAFFTSSRNHEYPYESVGSVSSARFYKGEPTSHERELLLENAEKSDEYIDEAVFALFEALQYENEADEYFKSRIDAEKYRKAANDLSRQVAAFGGVN